MYIIKRNGEQNEFNIEKITNAVEAANLSVSEEKQLTYHQIMSIAEKVQKKAHGLKRAVSVEEISDMEVVNKTTHKRNENKYMLTKKPHCHILKIV